MDHIQLFLAFKLFWGIFPGNWQKKTLSFQNETISESSLELPGKEIFFFKWVWNMSYPVEDSFEIHNNPH